MNIGLVIKSFDRSFGGAEHWTWQFARWLKAQGHQVHVVASHFAHDADRLGIVPHVVRAARSPLAWAAAAEATLKPLRLDVIHDMGQGWHGDVFQPHGGSRIASMEQNLLLLPRLLRPLKRQLARALPRYRDFRRLMARQFSSDGRRVIALSQMVAGHLARFHNVPPADLRLIYNGVDIERFSPDACRPHREAVRRRLGLRDETLLLIVAHNFRLKGVPTLLRAMACLRRQGRAVRLAVAGGKRFAGYRRAADRLGIAGEVTFLGPQEDVIPYYAATDAYVHPTFYDPCSLVVLEALACGLPVITSRFNGAGELIDEAREGFVIDDPADDAALVERIGVLLDPSTRAEMSRAARQRAEQHPWERNGREILAVYEETAGRRRRQAA